MKQSTLRQRLLTHIAVRLVVATMLLGSALVVQLRSPGTLPINPLFFLIALTYAVSLAFIGSLRFVERFPKLIDVHFAVDVVIVSAAVFLTGGVGSLFTTVYTLPIVAASSVQARRGGLQIAGLSSVLFVGLVLTQYMYASGDLNLPVELNLLRDLPSPDMARFTVGLNLFGFFAVAFVSGSLGERAVRGEEELEHATEEIADLQAFNQYVVDNLVSGLATADSQNRILTFNRSAIVITATTAPPVGRPAAEVLQLPEPFAATVGQDLSRVRSRRTDYSFRRSDGRVIDLGLSVATLPMPDGSRGFLYTFQDVTDMKRFEHNARLQQRLAAVGEMAAGIAHEIRNPLASMSGSMQMLRQELVLSGDQAQLMDIVLRESERLNQTIKSFLAYARPQRVQVQPLDLRTVVRETATLLRNSTDIGERHTIDVRQPDREVIVDADEGQIRQIVWNLATNGLKAMPDGGTLTISAVEESTSDGRFGVLRIEDEGVGIAPEDMDTIFQPFRGSFGKSTGLGLAIVHRLVSDYGGRIDVRARENRGTSFTVNFPAARRAAVGRQAS